MEQAPKRTLEGNVKYGIKMLLGTFIIASVTVNFASIVARYIAQAPLFWAEHIITYLMMWSVFIGASVVVWDERHLNMDLLYTVFPRRWKAVLRLISSIGIVVVLGIMLPYSWGVASMIFETDQRTAVGDFPLIIPHASLVGGFSLMILAALFRVYRSFRDVFTSDSAFQAQVAGQSIEGEH